LVRNSFPSPFSLGKKFSHPVAPHLNDCTLCTEHTPRNRRNFNPCQQPTTWGENLKTSWGKPAFTKENIPKIARRAKTPDATPQ